MFRHTLMLLVATGSLADSEFFTGRRQNYNSNANVNEVFPGYGKRLRPDVGVGRSRAGLYGGSPKYDIVLGPEMANGKDRGGLYGGSPKYDIVLGPDMANVKDRSGLYAGSPKYDIVLGPDTIKGKERTGLYGGSPKYEIVLGPDMATGKDRGGLYGGPQKFEIVLGPEMVNGRDRGGLLKFVKGGTGNGGFVSDYIASEDKGDGGGYGRGSCAALADILLSEDDDELAVKEEATDGDGSLEGLFEDNGNYNVVFKGGNRRHLSQQVSGVNSDPWESNDPNSNTVGSKDRRTYNWGTLRPTQLNVDDSDRTEQDSERPGQDYEEDYGDTNVNSNTNYNVISGRRRNDNSNTNNILISGRRRNDNSNTNDILVSGYGDTNVNSNTNYNVISGRRRNDNSNTNDILINYEGDGQDEGNIGYGQDEGNIRYSQDEGNRRYVQGEGNKRYVQDEGNRRYVQDEGNRRYVQDERNRRYGATPLYSGYDRAGPGYASYATNPLVSNRGYPAIGNTPRSAYSVLRESDVAEDDDEDADPQQNVNSNINSNVNSNVNVMSRRQNIKSKPNKNLFPRKKRSVNKFSTVSGRLDREENDGVSTVPTPDVNTAAKPVAEILEKPRSSIHRDLM